MKKTVFFLAVLFVAGFFSAKAQTNPSDSAYARDLSYVYINASNLPYFVNSLINGGKILKDQNMGPSGRQYGKRVKGYVITLSATKLIDIYLNKTSWNDWDEYLLLLDSNFNMIDYNDDANNGGSRITRALNPGTYYILASEYSHSSYNKAYNLTINARNVKTFSTLTYTAKTFRTPIVDTLGANCELVTDSMLYGNAYNAKGYTMQIPACYVKLTYDRDNRYVLLLDNNYNIIHNFYSSSTFNVQQSGTYRLVVLSSEYYDNDTSLSTFYTITTDSAHVVTFRTLPYQNISFGSTISDTLRNTDPSLLSHPLSSSYGMPFAKGYKIQTPATINYLDFVVDSADYDTYIFLLDANKDLIAQNDDDHIYESRLISQVNPSSTYYLVVSSYSYGDTGWFHFYTRGIQNIPTFYIDGVNGDDSRNGLTAGTALKTLDTAIARSGYVGKYLITEDYTFNNENSLKISHAEIYPYGKDINLKISDNCNSDIFNISESLIFGENGSNYYFIIDSNRTSNYSDFLDADWLGTYLEVNNLKVRNSYFPSGFLWGDKVVINNCEFTNDTINSSFLGIEEDGYNELKLTNCTLSQNIFHDDFIYHDYDYFKLTMENTTVSGNTFDEYYPALFYRATINLTSGSWRNNNLSANYNYNGNANLSTQNCAGIWAMDSTIVKIGSGFTMDANNYICIDSASTVNISENLTAPLVAQIYPMKWDNNSGYYVADYYEGRRLLTGSASMLSANYSKFSVAQADNSALWYLHPDGTIHTFDVSIDQAEEGTISLYPNPANNVLNIALQGTEVNEAVVIDIYGKTVARTAVAEGNNTLNISALPAGMYFVQLRAAGSVKATQKIVKR